MVLLGLAELAVMQLSCTLLPLSALALLQQALLTNTARSITCSFQKPQKCHAYKLEDKLKTLLSLALLSWDYWLTLLPVLNPYFFYSLYTHTLVIPLWPSYLSQLVSVARLVLRWHAELGAAGSIPGQRCQQCLEGNIAHTQIVLHKGREAMGAMSRNFGAH